MLILFKSLFLSTITFTFVFLLNSLFISINNNFIFFTSYFSFFIGGILNYVFYLKLVFNSYLNSKRVFFIYWCFIPIITLLQASIFRELLKIFDKLPNQYLSFLSTLLTIIICYPISFTFMYFLGNYAKKIQSKKKYN